MEESRNFMNAVLQAVGQVDEQEYDATKEIFFSGKGVLNYNVRAPHRDLDGKNQVFGYWQLGV